MAIPDTEPEILYKKNLYLDLVKKGIIAKGQRQHLLAVNKSRFHQNLNKHLKILPSKFTESLKVSYLTNKADVIH
ncbi:hypothetical protein GV64_09460 [Endozoicomonas elysicola]|uniref:Uncharacterized protein n=1 Tax=Endozoicomonas elysicola TaxID=305900 RepID=A0A081K9V6_9GAMM|nr:hypothetical protein GV64_09460 [Endozoicomonas elysicola]